MGDREQKYNAGGASRVGNPDPVATVLSVMVLAAVLEVVAAAASGGADTVSDDTVSGDTVSAHGWK
jgi:hypothetical protein